MSSDNAQQNGDIQRVSSDEAIKRMSRMMLEGWAMTGTICPVEECGNSVPLLRDRQDRLFCTRCNCYIQYGNEGEGQRQASGHEQSAERQTALNGVSEGSDESSRAYDDADNQLDNNDSEEAEFRSHISNVVSRKMGPLLLQGYRMLSETCDVPGCSSPILEKRGRKTCVICPDWKAPEQRGPGYFARIVLDGNEFKNPPPSLYNYVSRSTVGTSGQHEPTRSSNPWQEALGEVTSHMEADERHDALNSPSNERSQASAATSSDCHGASSISLGNTVVRDAPANWREMSDEQLSTFARGMRPPIPPAHAEATHPSTMGLERESNVTSTSTGRNPEQRPTTCDTNKAVRDTGVQSTPRIGAVHSAASETHIGQWEHTRRTTLDSIDYSIAQVSMELRNQSSSFGAHEEANHIKTATSNITLLGETLSRLRDLRRNYE
eukprot:gb/GECG01001887.1/.p1 GENE.gb/GECG01001887.1/~~gb/GECG01001887.1/.p1  ORF type:complete len:436 (+),score=42.13 gb/GECG01001887.1/:1-1308(+)